MTRNAKAGSISQNDMCPVHISKIERFAMAMTALVGCDADPYVIDRSHSTFGCPLGERAAEIIRLIPGSMNTRDVYTLLLKLSDVRNSSELT